MARGDDHAIAGMEERLGYRFRDRGALLRALTHASYANEHPGTVNHERLALVGDAALALVVIERLLGEDPAAAVGVLTPRASAIVAGANLARWASELGLGPLLRLGRGEELTGGRTRESILATSLEAVFGVIYMEDGLVALRGAVARLAGWHSGE